MPDKNGTFTVYKMFDAEGSILYVGMTKRGFRRFVEHQMDKDWFARVARTETEHFATRDECMEREAYLIRTLQPEHNAILLGPARIPFPDPTLTVSDEDVERMKKELKAVDTDHTKEGEAVTVAVIRSDDGGAWVFDHIEHVTLAEMVVRTAAWDRVIAALKDAPESGEKPDA